MESQYAWGRGRNPKKNKKADVKRKKDIVAK